MLPFLRGEEEGIRRNFQRMRDKKQRIGITPECRKQKKEYREKQKETIAEVLMFAASLLIALFLFIWALPRG